MQCIQSNNLVVTAPAFIPSMESEISKGILTVFDYLLFNIQILPNMWMDENRIPCFCDPYGG